MVVERIEETEDFESRVSVRLEPYHTTVADLIEVLKAFPQDMQVSIAGCFGGWLESDEAGYLNFCYDDPATFI